MSEQLTVTRERIEREAAALVGAPFRHQGSHPRTGIDCRGVIEWLGFRLYGRAIPPRKYKRKPSGREFYEKLSAEMTEIALADARAGDVVMIKFPRDPEARHAGVLKGGPFELMIVHAYEREGPGQVVEEPYRGWPQRCAVTAFRYPGVED